MIQIEANIFLIVFSSVLMCSCQPMDISDLAEVKSEQTTGDGPMKAVFTYTRYTSTLHMWRHIWTGYYLVGYCM